MRRKDLNDNRFKGIETSREDSLGGNKVKVITKISH